MAEWRYATHGFDGQRAEVDGVDVWQHTWIPVEGATASVTDPLYGQPFQFQVYEIKAGGKRIVFAAGEFSNGVWGFFAPATSAA